MYEELEKLREEVLLEIKKKLLYTAKVIIENLLVEEITEFLNVLPYERNNNRKDYRNGKYKRTLLTSLGYIPELNVPRIRNGKFPYKTIEKYKRRTPDVDKSIGKLYINGISTRKLSALLKEIYGKEVSAQTISKTQKILDEDVAKFKSKPIEDNIEFLFLDGLTQKVREIGIENKTMLCAYGIYKNGRKEILSFQLVDIENTDVWRGFLVDLKSRGLLGKNLKLIITDGNPGLLKAINEIYPFIKVQRCIAHKLRNIASKLKKRNKKVCMEGAKLIFAADSKKEAIQRFKLWKEYWQIEEERAVRCLEKDLYHCLHYYNFESFLWRTIRTTNPLERAIREIRRRTRPMNIFPNEDSCNRITYSIMDMLNKNWEKKFLRNLTRMSF